MFGCAGMEMKGEVVLVRWMGECGSQLDCCIKSWSCESVVEWLENVVLVLWRFGAGDVVLVAL